MNREILFRGKRADNGEWVYGSLLNNRKDTVGSAYIIPFFVDSSKFDYIEVDPSTVGQFTGLTDKNGVRIFEGDVLHFKTYSGGGFGRVGLDAYSEVIYGEHNLSGDYTIGRAIGFYLNRDEDNVSIQYWVNSHKATVVGNRFDNPELIK